MEKVLDKRGEMVYNHFRSFTSVPKGGTGRTGTVRGRKGFDGDNETR